MKFKELQQYQDNQGDICLLFFFEDAIHYLKTGDVTGKPFLYCSVSNTYYSSVFAPSKNETEKIIAKCLELIGGESELKRLLKQGQPTYTGILLAIADNTGGLQWVGKDAQSVAV